MLCLFLLSYVIYISETRIKDIFICYTTGIPDYRLLVASGLSLRFLNTIGQNIMHYEKIV
jgi:hypothetical protein